MAVHNAAPFDGSLSPPLYTQPLTKRDVRRNRITEKLQGMIDSFSSNQHQHYRAQLQALQVDMTLVLRADPYTGLPGDGGDGAGDEAFGGVLEDSGEDIKNLVDSIGANLPDDEAAQKDFWALAGSKYREFVREVNDCVEQRDADLVALHDHYQSSVSELDRLTRQKLHQAQEEHKALADTIRQRLIASITKKKQQLMRDKEQLDIADSNALLLHPNHFSINNPGSPGNGTQNRKTRHLRHRAGSPNPGDLDANGKRKRKAAAMEDEGNESPVPAFKTLVAQDAFGGGRSPFKDARKENVYAQYEAPAYSMERIFTEKELALATDTAKVATYRYFHQPQQAAAEDGPTGNNGTAVPSVDGEAADPVDGEEAAAQPTTEGGIATPPLSQPFAVEMERQTSHQVLTRGGARANPLAALSELATAASSASAAGYPARDNPFAPQVPSYHAVTKSDKAGAPPPASVNLLDTENDFEMMRQSGSHQPAAEEDGDEAMSDAATVDSAAALRRQLLDHALGESGASQPYRLPLLETGPALIGKGVERLVSSGFAPALATEQRLRQQVHSYAATSGIGGAMSAALQGKFSMGGEVMSRTTSAGGASEMGESVAMATSGGRKGRGRLV